MSDQTPTQDDAAFLTPTEKALVTAARIVDAYGDRPVPWIHRAVLRFAAHMTQADTDDE